jgi:hypothetical protein
MSEFFGLNGTDEVKSRFNSYQESAKGLASWLILKKGDVELGLTVEQAQILAEQISNRLLSPPTSNHEGAFKFVNPSEAVPILVSGISMKRDGCHVSLSCPNADRQSDRRGESVHFTIGENLMVPDVLAAFSNAILTLDYKIRGKLVASY